MLAGACRLLLDGPVGCSSLSQMPARKISIRITTTTTTTATTTTIISIIICYYYYYYCYYLIPARVVDRRQHMNTVIVDVST